MAAYLKKPFTYNPLIARKPLIRVKVIIGSIGDPGPERWRAEQDNEGAVADRRADDEQAPPVVARWLQGEEAIAPVGKRQGGDCAGAPQDGQPQGRPKRVD